MGAEIHDTVERRLRRGRQRYTSGRRELVGVLAEVGQPLTIPEILDHTDELSQSSVYRNLQVLEQTGSVRRVVTGSGTGARFELTEDLTSHHHHLICRACGSVQDFHPSGELEQALSGLTDTAAAGGFEPDHHRLDLIGLCADCSA